MGVSIKSIWHYGGKLVKLGPYMGHIIIGTPDYILNKRLNSQISKRNHFGPKCHTKPTFD
jgi:hypothetical protein